jgi:transcriptional regulator with XRE-family HTH domain
LCYSTRKILIPLEISGEDIKKFREKNGITQSRLGQMIGVHKNTIINYEKGEVIPESKQRLLSDIIKEASNLVQELNSPRYGNISTLGNRIREKREMKGLTLQQLADFMGKQNKTVVSSWELDERIPEGKVLVDSARYARMLEELNDQKDKQLKEKEVQLKSLKNNH